MPRQPATAPTAAVPPPVATGRRVVVEAVEPSVDDGRFPVKRCAGEKVEVSADVFANGVDLLAGVVRYRHTDETEWREVGLEFLDNDRWGASFVVERLGRYEFAVSAWVDPFATWSDGLSKKAAAKLNVGNELIEGAALVRAGAGRASGTDAAWLVARADLLADPKGAKRVAAGLSPRLARLMARYPDRTLATDSPVFAVTVDSARAGGGAWYELFPRSAAAVAGRHGTFADVEARLPYVAGMGFDVLYLPPIHPIGHTNRKGRNGATKAAPSDPGCPWAIGAAEGGHDAVLPELGTLDDFRRLVETARRCGLDVALDLALQCSPDHPWVSEHPHWFRHRPDGSVKFAENPPREYQDIYPLDFEGPAWRELWEEVHRLVLFWIGCGVTIFRVDNPHTKPFEFWEWLIAAVRAEHPDVVFLAEAFTRPKLMRRLSKCGFSQTYTYFTWRTTKAELIEYFTELFRTEVREYLRPNLFANTPDVLSPFLQNGGRPAFAIRVVLAATLGASYGIYGPAYELCETRALPESEDYRDSEMYEIRHWDLDRPDSLRPLITAVNAARRENPALLTPWSVQFVPTDNDQLLAYAKRSDDGGNLVLVVVNVDPRWQQSGWLDFPIRSFGIAADQPYEMHDLLSGARYVWRGGRNFIALDPGCQPAHVFRVSISAPAAGPDTPGRDGT